MNQIPTPQEAGIAAVKNYTERYARELAQARYSVAFFMLEGANRANVRVEYELAEFVKIQLIQDMNNSGWPHARLVERRDYHNGPTYLHMAWDKPSPIVVKAKSWWSRLWGAK